MKNFYFPLKLLKSGFMANVRWREEPGFGMLHHIIYVDETKEITGPFYVCMKKPPRLTKCVTHKINARKRCKMHFIFGPNLVEQLSIHVTINESVITGNACVTDNIMVCALGSQD